MISWYAAALANAIAAFDVVPIWFMRRPAVVNVTWLSDVEQTDRSVSLDVHTAQLGVKRVVFVRVALCTAGRSKIPRPKRRPLSRSRHTASVSSLSVVSGVVRALAWPRSPRATGNECVWSFHNAAKSEGIIGTLISRALREQKIEIWGDGSVVRDFVYVDDVVDAWRLRSSIAATSATSTSAVAMATVARDYRGD